MSTFCTRSQNWTIGRLMMACSKTRLTQYQSAREVSEDKFDGYLSMLIMDLNISTLRQQNMLMCNEWSDSNSTVIQDDRALTI
jgi:hypothetical protein